MKETGARNLPVGKKRTAEYTVYQKTKKSKKHLTIIYAYDIILLVAGELQRKTSAFVGA